MLTRCVEKGREKCDHYWPYDTMPVYYGDISVQILNETRYPDWNISEFMVCRVSTYLLRSLGFQEICISFLITGRYTKGYEAFPFHDMARFWCTKSSTYISSICKGIQRTFRSRSTSNSSTLQVNFYFYFANNNCLKTILEWKCIK